MDMAKIRIDSLRIIDWYDGVVRAIVGSRAMNFMVFRSKWRPGTYDQPDKIEYAWKEIDKTTTDSIMQLLELVDNDGAMTDEASAKFEQIFDLIIGDSEDNVGLSYTPPNVGKSVDLLISKPAWEFLELRGYSLEKVIETTKQHPFA